MVPGAVVRLDRLPLTANGKVDRRALPAPDEIQPEREETCVAPETAVEEVLAGIWAEVLNLKQVSILDDFFESGGHSLLASQVIARVRDTFQVEIPLRSLFETPTVAGLAERIEAVLRAGQGLQAPPLERVSRDEPLPLSFAQQRLWFLEQLEPGNPAYNIAVAVRLSGELDVTALERSFSEMVRRHEVLRTRFVVVEGEPQQVIDAAGPVVLEMEDLMGLSWEHQEAAVRRVARQQAEQRFDLTGGPLLRAGLVRLAEREHVLVLTMHHIISDGWSQGVLIRELVQLYEALSRGQESPLPGLAIQYADYAHWQRRWLQGEELEKQLGYWKGRLEAAPGVLELPTDHRRPAVQSFRGASQRVELEAGLSEALKELSRQEGVTLFMTLLAAFQSLLHHYTGRDDILVGSDIANRSRVEIEGLIGFFSNMLVLRTDLSGDPSFRELLGRVREVTLGAYAHQDLPFEKLVDELRPERDLSHNPLFQVVFTLQNAPKPLPDLPGLTLSPLHIENTTAKFDLVLNMWETEQGLTGSMQYNTDLFEATTMARMLRHFENLLRSIVAQPGVRLSALEMLSDEETVLLEKSVTVEELEVSFSF
jgi:acyl carrier protein